MTETTENKKKTWINRIFGSKRRMIIYLTIIVILTAICAIPNGRETFQRGAMSLLPTPSPAIINLAGTPEEMGRIHGNAFKYSLKALEKIYIKLIICGNSSDRLNDYCAKAKEIFARINPRWTQEIKAVAAASGTDPGTRLCWATLFWTSESAAPAAGC